MLLGLVHRMGNVSSHIGHTLNPTSEANPFSFFSHKLLFVSGFVFLYSKAPVVRYVTLQGCPQVSGLIGTVISSVGAAGIRN